MKKIRFLLVTFALTMATLSYADAAPTASFVCSDDCGGILGSGD